MQNLSDMQYFETHPRIWSQQQQFSPKMLRTIAMFCAREASKTSRGQIRTKH